MPPLCGSASLDHLQDVFHLRDVFLIHQSEGLWQECRPIASAVQVVLINVAISDLCFEPIDQHDRCEPDRRPGCSAAAHIRC